MMEALSKEFRMGTAVRRRFDSDGGDKRGIDSKVKSLERGHGGKGVKSQYRED